MRIAIMQPYFFPYLGYFQLISAVDRFVVLDDVNFIKRGWVNRNNLLQDGEAQLFTIPLSGASQNRKINEILLSDEGDWREKLLRRLEMCYRKAPMFPFVFPMVRNVLDVSGVSIGELNRTAMMKVLGYMDIQKEVVPSSSVYGNSDLKGKDRIIDICMREAATHYINPIGGVELYASAEFEARGVKLSFLRGNLPGYQQFGNSFVSGLSMIDVLMFNDPLVVTRMLTDFTLE